MKVLLLSFLVAAVAAAPRVFEDKPQDVPESVVLPAPAQPEIVPGPVILPPPILPGPGLEPEVEPEPVIIVDDPIVDEEPIAQIPNGEIYNDGLVQISVNASEEAGYLASLQSWFSMILNYFNNGVQSSHQIV